MVPRSREVQGGGLKYPALVGVGYYAPVFVNLGKSIEIAFEIMLIICASFPGCEEAAGAPSGVSEDGELAQRGAAGAQKTQSLKTLSRATGKHSNSAVITAPQDPPPPHFRDCEGMLLLSPCLMLISHLFQLADSWPESPRLGDACFSQLALVNISVSSCLLRSYCAHLSNSQS